MALGCSSLTMKQAHGSHFPTLSARRRTVNSARGKTTNLHPHFHHEIDSYKLPHNGSGNAVLPSRVGPKWDLPGSEDDLLHTIMALVIELKWGWRLILLYGFIKAQEGLTVPWYMTSWRRGWRAWWTGPVPGSSGLWSLPSARPGRSHHHPPSSSSWECLADGPEDTWDQTRGS